MLFQLHHHVVCKPHQRGRRVLLSSCHLGYHYVWSHLASQSLLSAYRAGPVRMDPCCSRPLSNPGSRPLLCWYLSGSAKAGTLLLFTQVYADFLQAFQVADV